jgi:hypothetical protein
VSITLEHVQVRQEQTADAPVAAPAKRPGLLALLAEAVRAARAVSTADGRTSVAIAARFADRIS